MLPSGPWQGADEIYLPAVTDSCDLDRMIFLDMGSPALAGATFAVTDLLRHLGIHAGPPIVPRDVVEHRVLGLVAVVVEFRDNPSPFRLCLDDSLPLRFLLSPETSVLQLKLVSHSLDLLLEGLASDESLAFGVPS